MPTPTVYWPGDLPTRPQSDSYQEAPPELAIQGDTDLGPPKTASFRRPVAIPQPVVALLRELRMKARATRAVRTPPAPMS